MTESPGRVRVKICGLRRPADAREAAGAGADFVGCVLVPGSPRETTVAEAGAVGQAAGLPLVLVVADRSADWLVAAATGSGASVIQLHGNESPSFAAALADRGPWSVWKGVRTPDPATARAAVSNYGGVVHGLLLDGYAPDALGGTGVTFDWEAVSPVREALPSRCLFIAAGGLNPENVGRAVSILHPDVVDVSSGVEVAPGVKDPLRIRTFIERARTTSTVRRDP